MENSPGCLIHVIGLSLFFNVITGFNIDIENVLIFEGPNTGSYFGFSSALGKDKDGVWLIVGAPKDNSTAVPDIPFTGNLYRCPVNFHGNTSIPCNQTLNAVQSETKEPDMTFKQYNQQLGANVYVDQTENRIFACSSLYKRTYREKSTHHVYEVGRCGYSNISRPEETPTYFKFRGLTMTDQTAWQWGKAQIGFSFSPVENMPAMNGVLGCPGVLDGKGGFMLVDTGQTGEKVFKAYSINQNRDIEGSFKRGSLLGYAVASSKFEGRRMSSILAGAPRYSSTEGYVGKVLIIDATQDGSYTVPKAFAGKQSGAGFGSSLIVTDINGDGFEDLFVGSPYFSTLQQADEGLVNVFYGTGDDEMLRETPLELKGSRKRNGRFGLSMTALGDINDDNFNDLAVGAPYEDDKRGAVYIYNGNAGDLKTEYSQRIAAGDLDSGLRAFGFSISRPFDSDSNQYNDISVGAYLSDKAVLLRSRPVVRVDIDLTLNPLYITLNSSGLSCRISEEDINPCVDVMACFNFTGKGVENLNISFTLSADTDRTEQRKASRILLNQPDKTFSSSITDVLHLKAGRANCKAVKARVPSISREFFRQIEHQIKFKLNFRLNSEPIPGSVLPILDKKNQRKTATQGNITTGCTSGICSTDLRLDVVLHTEGDIIILGRTQEVAIRVDVKNVGNPAYGTTVLLRSSKNAAYTDAYQSVGEGTELVVCNETFPGSSGDNDALCEFERPFFKQQRAVFRAIFNVSMEQMLPPGGDLSDLNDTVTINIRTDVSTPSQETDESNNKITKTLDVRLMADIEITSSSDHDQKRISADADGSLTFTHSYEVYNRGPSPLPGSIFIMNIPVQYFGQEKHDITVKSTGNCRFLPFDKELPPESFIEGSDFHVLSRKRREAQPETLKPRSSFTNMSCTEPEVECIYLECAIGLLEINEIFNVDVRINLIESELKFEKGAVGIRYSTTATVHPPQRMFIPWSTVKTGIVNMDLYPATVKPIAEKIPMWIIIVGCIGGLLLFVLFGLLLWKLGFFKRKKRDEVDNWKRKSGYEQRRSQRVSGRQRGNAKSRIPSTSPDCMEEKYPGGFE